MRFKKSFFLFWLISLTLYSCSSVKDLPSNANAIKSVCYNKSDYNYTVEKIPKNLLPEELDPVLNKNFSFDALNVANAIGVMEPLKKYILLKTKYAQDSSIENRINILENRQKIIQKINTSSLEISSVTSELDCEEERAEQLANFMKEQIDEREKNLVIGSIILGAAGAITAEVLNNNPSAGKSGSYVAIGSAIAEATLGVLMLTNKQRIYFSHERNTIGEIMDNVTVSKTLPPSIWYYLNYKNDTDKKQSLQKILVENWETFGQIGKKKKQENNTQQIYFGRGGKYTSEELKNRANMLDQIKSYIKLMKQDLETLSVEFEKL